MSRRLLSRVNPSAVDPFGIVNYFASTNASKSWRMLFSVGHNISKSDSFGLSALQPLDVTFSGKGNEEMDTQVYKTDVLWNLLGIFICLRHWKRKERELCVSCVISWKEEKYHATDKRSMKDRKSRSASKSFDLSWSLSLSLFLSLSFLLFFVWREMCHVMSCSSF
jgi:hypothetical protein